MAIPGRIKGGTREFPKRSNGLGRFLRIFTGVQEDVLDEVPGDRPRYTAMGGVVLGTALMAMVSMAVAIYSVFGGFHPILVPVVVVWGMFIVSLDRWLMSTTTSGQFVKKLLPRLVLSVILGFIIAEPLLLGIFHTAITERVAADRSKEVIDTEADLKRCNPVPGTPEAGKPEANTAFCLQRRLTVDGEVPETLIADLDSKTKNANDFRATLKTDQDKYAQLNDLARRECNGTTGPGLTGRIGEGPNCKRLRSEADQYYVDTRIRAREQELANLERDVTAATNRLGASQVEYGRKLNDAIAVKVRQVHERQKEVGLLERMRTLGTLVSEDTYVHAWQWALRVFFIIVDSLPVALKVLTGVTAYDRLIASRTGLQEQTGRMRDKTTARQRAEHEDLERHKVFVEYRDERRQYDLQAQLHNAVWVEKRNMLIAAKERQLLREAMQSAVDGGDTIEIDYGGVRRGAHSRTTDEE